VPSSDNGITDEDINYVPKKKKPWLMVVTVVLILMLAISFLFY
tara:strand:+ start:580 stop:708 length:129 start_codon:yes stop_codon:yes gene_type:complete